MLSSLLQICAILCCIALAFKMGYHEPHHGVNFYAPTCCQSATFGPLFAFYCPLFFYEKKKKMSHFARDAMFTLLDRWICVIDKLCCANDGATALQQINR